MRGRRSPKLAGLALAAMIAAGVAAPLAGRAATPSATSAGVWQRMPAAPVAPDFDRRTAVWTGTQLIVFGRVHLSPNTLLKSVNVAAAYDPATRQWRKLTPPPGPAGSFGSDHAVWTGRKMLVWGGSSNLTYDPASDRWGTDPRLAQRRPRGSSPGRAASSSDGAAAAAVTRSTTAWRTPRRRAPGTGWRGPRWRGANAPSAPGRDASSSCSSPGRTRMESPGQSASPGPRRTTHAPTPGVGSRPCRRR